MSGWQKAGLAAGVATAASIVLAFLSLYFAVGLGLVRWLWS